MKVKGTEEGQKIKGSRNIIRKEMKIKKWTSNGLIQKDKEKINRMDCGMEKRKKE